MLYKPLKTKPHHRQYRTGGRVRHDRRAAVARALTGARLLLGLPVAKPSSLASAAAMCGASAPYIAAAVTLLRAEDKELIELVHRGHIPLIQTAKQLRSRAAALAAYRAMAVEDKIALGQAIGVDELFNDVIVPALDQA
jgi:hypothetical protein